MRVTPEERDELMRGLALLYEKTRTFITFNADWQGYSAAFGGQPSNDLWSVQPGRDGMPFQGSVGLGAYSAIILSQDQ